MLKPIDGVLVLSCKEDESYRDAIIRTLIKHEASSETIEESLRNFDTIVASGCNELMAAIESIHWIQF